MNNTNEHEKESLEEMEHDLVILLLGFGGFCPFFMPAGKDAPQTEKAKPEPKVKKEPVRSAAEKESLEKAFYLARQKEFSVSISAMAEEMGITPSTVRKKLNKYPERFAPYLGRVELLISDD